MIASVDNDKITVLNKQLDYYKKQLEIVKDTKDDLIELINRFNGKKFTKRFTNQLQEINPHYYVRTNNGMSLNILLYLSEDRFVQGERHTLYVDDDTCYVAWYSKSWNESELTIKGEELIPRIDCTINSLETTIEKLENNINNVNSIINEFNNIQESIKRFLQDKNTVFKDVIGLKFTNY